MGCDGVTAHRDAVTTSTRVSWWPKWGRHAAINKPWRPRSDAVTESHPLSFWNLSEYRPSPWTSAFMTPSLRKYLVNFRVSWDFFIFRTFSLQKRPKVLLLWFPLQKHLKWEKKRLWVKSNQIIYELGLKQNPKNVTFFVSSGTANTTGKRVKQRMSASSYVN